MALFGAGADSGGASLAGAAGEGVSREVSHEEAKAGTARNALMAMMVRMNSGFFIFILIVPQPLRVEGRDTQR